MLLLLRSKPPGGALAAARAGTVGFAGTYVSGGGGPPTTLDALGAWAAALGAQLSGRRTRPVAS